MTKDEALKIPELCIEVTPLVEDAFFFLKYIEDRKPIDEVMAMDDVQEREYDLFCQASQNAGDRLAKLPMEERMEAIGIAYRMMDNIRKYGVACAEWAAD